MKRYYCVVPMCTCSDALTLQQCMYMLIIIAARVKKAMLLVCIRQNDSGLMDVLKDTFKGAVK